MLFLPHLLKGLLGLVLGPGASFSCYQTLLPGFVVLRASALMSEGTACAEVTLGSQLFPPCTAVLLPAV